MGFYCLKARATLRRQSTFYHLVPRNSWHSFCQPLKDERLNQPRSYPVVLNTGPLDWESSALTSNLTNDLCENSKFHASLKSNYFKLTFLLMYQTNIIQMILKGDQKESLRSQDLDYFIILFYFMKSILFCGLFQ